MMDRPGSPVSALSSGKAVGFAGPDCSWTVLFNAKELHAQKPSVCGNGGHSKTLQPYCEGTKAERAGSKGKHITAQVCVRKRVVCVCVSHTHDAFLKCLQVLSVLKPTYQ